MKFKDYYSKECAKILSGKIKPFYPELKEKLFINYISENVPNKDFFERMDIFVNAIEYYMPNTYDKNISIFEKILGPELQKETGMFSEDWWLWPIGRYVEKHGIENIKLSLSFIKELTKRFTGEYAIRPLLKNKPKEVIKTMIKWSKDKNVHVRRLASEGVRISLPWSKKLYTAVEDFVNYKIILTNLKNDTSKFVQKSVGNNFNDLYKEFPDKATEIIKEWKKDNPTKETQWIIKHGLRSTKNKGKGPAALV